VANYRGCRDKIASSWASVPVALVVLVSFNRHPSHDTPSSSKRSWYRCPSDLSNVVRQRHGSSGRARAAGMRRLAGRLLAPASHARLRLRAAPAAAAAGAVAGAAAAVTDTAASALPRSAIARQQSTTPWRPRRRPLHGQLLQQKRWMYLTPPLSQDAPSSTPSSTPLAAAPTASSATSPPLDEEGKLDSSVFQNLPFRFDTGVALFAKRTPRPFPPPFLSPPSGSFSDPLSTHDRSRDRRRAYVGGRLIQGLTNGDDAVFASDYFICANDGVGAWSTRPRGHAG